MQEANLHAERAYTAYELNRYENCIAEARSALAIEPEHEMALTLIILSHSHLNNYEQGLDLGKEALKRLPNSEDIHFAIGTLYLRAGHPHSALRHLHLAVEIDPLASNYFVNLGIAYWSLGRKKNALAYFDNALKLNPENGLAHNLISQIQKDKNQKLEAIGSINKALNLNPESAYHHAVKGQLEIGQGNYEAASNHFEAALRTDPTDITSRHLFLESGFLSNPTFAFLNKLFPAPKDAFHTQMLVLTGGIFLFNYFASVGSINTPPQIWVWLLLFPIFFFWVLKPILKIQLFQERFGKQSLEHIDPALPVTLGAMIAVLLLCIYLAFRLPYFAWFSAFLIISSTMCTYVLISEGGAERIPIFKNPWKSFWMILVGSSLASMLFFQLSQMG